MAKVRELRIELWCGSLDSLAETNERYSKADEIAKRFNIPTSFNESTDNGKVYFDGYIYPRSNHLLRVLDALDKAGVEYDNIDLPDSLVGSELHKKLEKKYPPPTGIYVNPGDIEERPRFCGYKPREKFTPFYSERRPVRSYLKRAQVALPVMTRRPIAVRSYRRRR